VPFFKTTPPVDCMVAQISLKIIILKVRFNLISI